MPIGKSSLKRVANNGYSNVKTEAPDMENSVEVKEKPKSTAAKKPASKKTQPKTEAKPVPKAKTAEAKPAAKKTQPKAEAKPAPEAETEKPYVNVGRDMPAYLL